MRVETSPKRSSQQARTAEVQEKLAGQGGPSTGAAWKSWRRPRWLRRDAASRVSAPSLGWPDRLVAARLPEVDERLAGAGGLSGCARQPLEPIVPYVRQPERSSWASPCSSPRAMPFGGYGNPVLVESHEGRPTKIEGNPSILPAWAVAMCSPRLLLDLYDPDRSQTIPTWASPAPGARSLDALQGPLSAQKAVQGAGLRILTAHQFAHHGAQMKQVAGGLPAVEVVQYEPVNRDNVRAGAQLAFGEPSRRSYQLGEGRRHSVAGRRLFVQRLPGFPRLRAQFAEPAQPRSQARRCRASTPSRARRPTPGQGGSSLAGAGLGSGAVRARAWPPVWAPAAAAKAEAASSRSLSRRW